MGRGKETENDQTEEIATGVSEFSVSASGDEGARKIVTSFDFGGTTARAVELFDEESVYANFLKGAKVALQSKIRTLLALDGADAKSDDEILQAITEWKPGARSTRAASNTSKAEKIIDKMSDEERQALIAKLQEMNG